MAAVGATWRRPALSSKPIRSRKHSRASIVVVTIVVAATFLGDLAAVHDDETEVAESNDIKAAHGSVFVSRSADLSVSRHRRAKTLPDEPDLFQCEQRRPRTSVENALFLAS